jgi:hypothetical protein
MTDRTSASRKAVREAAGRGMPSQWKAAAGPWPRDASMHKAGYGACTCGGGCPRCTGKSAVAVSQPDDPAERTAKRLAAQALDAPRGRVPKRFAISGATVNHANASPFGLGAGAPLDAAERAYFGRRFGADLSPVRVHIGERAAAAAKLLGARAFTSGSHVVFGAGGYSPRSATGRQLLAHELAHTLQPPSAVPTILRQAEDAEPENRRRLRTALVDLIPRVLHRIEQSVIRGYGGLYEFESRTPGGGILMGGPGTPEETLAHRRARLLDLAADLRAMAERLARGSIPESWWNAAVTRSSSGRGISIGGFGENVEALAIMYQQFAEESGRDALIAFFNYGYVQPLSPATASSRPSDTGIDVVAPDPGRPARVLRVFGSTPMLTDPETGLPNRSPVYRVQHDERGYFYLTGPAWLGPHRRVDLDPSVLGITR